MSNPRPNPDELLARVQAEEAQQDCGKLKIFFGASAGVGKTYAMIEAAREKHAEGVDVLVGLIETHGRAETEALLHAPTPRGVLPILPRHAVEYRGAILEEFDLDAAIARRPALLLVDELAHTNAPGTRHPKRWQDVEELLAAGIDVYTTINVQHVESLKDVVAQITGVLVRETVPDRMIEQADEVELIDLTPDDLLQRLKEGKVYVPQQAERAMHNFFRKGNLIALRELALRRTADRVDAQMRGYMREHAIPRTWPTAERILVCVGPGVLGARLVRAACRMAAGLHAEWIVATVETPSTARLPENERDQIVQALRLAEQLGAQTATLSGQHVSEVALAYARTRNVTKIVVGKPARPRWKEILFGSTVDELVRRSGEIDVYVMTGDQDNAPVRSPAMRIERTNDWSAYRLGILTVVLVTLIAWAILPYVALANLIMIYLVGVVLVAMRFGRGPSIVASLLSVAAFDFFFVPPYLTLAVADVEYVITFAVMLLVGLVISTLMVRLRQQAAAAQQREQRVAALYAMSREFASSRGLTRVLRAAVRNIHQMFDSQVVILLPNQSGRLQAWGDAAGWWGEGVNERTIFAPDVHEQGVAQWVYDHGQVAGQGTDTLAGAKAVYVPLTASRGAIGVLGVRPDQPRRFLAPDQLHLLETFASQAALALERVALAREAHHAQVRAETERLRNALLSSVSHDLRTPLAAIAGSASSLIADDADLDRDTRRELMETIFEESDRLSRLVANLLDITRIESGAIQVHKEWQPLEEVVGAALTRLEQRLQERPLTISLPDDLPLVPLDGALIEQLLVNVLENALKYSPPGSPIAISAWPAEGAVVVEIADAGPGLPAGAEQRVFEKFYRGRPENGSGAGLGLTICRGIAEAHGGRIWAENRPGGGARIRFSLPIDGQPPLPALDANEPIPIGTLADD